jgi:hypothetical protein
MSKEAVMELLAKADEDEGLRQELDAIAEESGDHAAGLLAVAERHGCHFTAEEFGEALEALSSEGSELSDDDLDAVVGGIGPGRPPMRPRTIGTFKRLKDVVSPVGALPEPTPGPAIFR